MVFEKFVFLHNILGVSRWQQYNIIYNILYIGV